MTVSGGSNSGEHVRDIFPPLPVVTVNGSMKITDTFEFLLGSWRIERTLKDHRSGTRGTFNGMASVADQRPCSSFSLLVRAHYEEIGELHWGTHQSSAHRSLRFIRRDDGTLAVHFSDERPFIDLDLRAGAWRSNHVCGDDRYEFTTRVMSPNVVEERWRVRGPTKDYDATATLTRYLRGESRPREMVRRHK